MKDSCEAIPIHGARFLIILERVWKVGLAMWHRRPGLRPNAVRRVGLGLPGPAVFSVFGRLKPTLHDYRNPAMVKLAAGKVNNAWVIC